MPFGFVVLVATARNFHAADAVRLRAALFLLSRTPPTSLLRMDESCGARLIELMCFRHMLHDERPALKPGFNGRNNHDYSSSSLRF